MGLPPAHALPIRIGVTIADSLHAADAPTYECHALHDGSDTDWRRCETVIPSGSGDRDKVWDPVILYNESGTVHATTGSAHVMMYKPYGNGGEQWAYWAFIDYKDGEEVGCRFCSDSGGANTPPVTKVAAGLSHEQGRCVQVNDYVCEDVPDLEPSGAFGGALYLDP
ncbi:MAG: hypothetical protein V4510_11605 [bacterium]